MDIKIVELSMVFKVAADEFMLNVTVHSFARVDSPPPSGRTSKWKK